MARAPAPNERSTIALARFVGALAAFVASSCVQAESSWEPGPASRGVSPSPRVIDAGAEVELEQGVGVGVAIEYEGAGWWAVATVCDTLLTDESCHFDLVCSTDEDAGIVEIEGVELEPDDDFFFLDDFAVQADFLTRTRSDTLRFRTTPGAGVRLSALLYDPAVPGDWTDDPRIISWVGGGGLHWGAPDNPLDLEPDSP